MSSNPVTTTYTREYLTCPWCGGESGQRVDHLYTAATFPVHGGPWYCDDCGMPMDVLVIAPGDVETSRSANHGSRVRSMVLLRADGVDCPVYLVFDHDRYLGDTDDQEHQRFLFEEHSCPQNWMHECVAIIKDGDCDPHGFFKFVRSVDVPEDFDVDSEAWFSLFPEAFDEGPVIDAEPVRLAIEERRS